MEPTEKDINELRSSFLKRCGEEKVISLGKGKQPNLLMFCLQNLGHFRQALKILILLPKPMQYVYCCYLNRFSMYIITGKTCLGLEFSRRLIQRKKNSRLRIEI